MSRLLLICVLGATGGALAQGEEPAQGEAPAAGAALEPALRFDPFAPRDVSLASGAERGGEKGRWSPVLRGTILSRDDSLANFGGDVLRIGEESHGYTLVEVREGEAVFLRDGLRITLAVDPRAAD